MEPWHAPVSIQSDPRHFKDRNSFVVKLSGAINDQATAVKFYEALEGMAPSKYRDFVSHAKNDEMLHVRLLSKLYRKLTGHRPNVQAGKTQFASYKDGIETAFRGELEAAELYRDMYLSTRIPEVRDVLFRTMTDEMEHAQRFNFLYTLANNS
ncbi:ferritin-like domain-containing protein [Alicyclobacillus sp. ALC3]|uniref:ferritin-like domain-containing protein n=1 Tax=Alicyclobacillus sp. ALC3 TaxID=2796143 RepID=UPI0023795AD5|nr:ferritin-like domain-containing protein [Alicyclobacillus sp. ALC3]WDL97599.1 ferritin-like domain-containing protein [Alicyclobacillus sp. ALC3]